MSTDDAFPSNLYQGAAWLREPHPRVDQIGARIAGDTEQKLGWP